MLEELSPHKFASGIANAQQHGCSPTNLFCLCFVVSFPAFPLHHALPLLGHVIFRWNLTQIESLCWGNTMEFWSIHGRSCYGLMGEAIANFIYFVSRNDWARLYGVNIKIKLCALQGKSCLRVCRAGKRTHCGVSSLRFSLISVYGIEHNACMFDKHVTGYPTSTLARVVLSCF